ncbi:MAG: class I SAM-dependent methyltransferase [Chloroflexota bacterium]
MTDHKTVYSEQADKYEALIAREDYQGNILRALQAITSLAGQAVLDLGAGTGRLAVLLAPHVERIRAFDVAEDMLRVCAERLTASGLSNWQTDVADHRHLPVGDHFADLVVSGWSVSYLAVWDPERWREGLDAWMDEMKRVLKPGGLVVLYESLGTGNAEPIRLPHLEKFYPWLDEMGFQNQWIRTDYQFKSLEEAVDLAGFFFGAELAERVQKENLVILPECTGVWWKKV